MQNDKFLVEEFEKDIWLFLDKSLPEERMIFWENQIANSEQIKLILDEITTFLGNYNKFPTEQIDHQKLTEIASKAVKHERTFSKVKSWFKTDNDKKTLIPKIAFATSLTLAALVMLILSQRPNPVNKISNEVFAWNDDETTTQVQNISSTLSMIDDENLKKFILYKTMQDEWNKSIYKIENRIKSLDNEIDETSL